MSDSTHTVTLRAFDSAYPGSMFDKPHGEYVERGDASSLAAALLELVAKHKRDAEDFEDALKQEKAERDALRAEFERLAAQAEPAPASVNKQALITKLRYMGRQYAAGITARGGGTQKHYLEEAADEIEMMALALSMNEKTPAPAPVGEYPALPEPSSTAYIQGHSGGEYRTLSDSYEPDCAMFSPQQMHAYIDADRAQRPDREVRLLTSKDIDDVRKTLWRDAQMNLSDLHAEDAAKAFQRKFCEVNGLTVKDQS